MNTREAVAAPGPAVTASHPDTAVSSAPARGRISPKKLAKYVGVAAAGAAFAFFLPWVALFYAVCGLYDVARNRPANGAVLRQYFLVNGTLTWLLSPFNILLDLLTLPYINKGVYRLEDLPPAYRAEVEELIAIATRENLVGQLEERAKELDRTMIFFKWYGENVDTFLQTPSFHKPWKYIQTIGVSIFNRKISTSKHFGPIRPTLRVLYNLNDVGDRSAYIVVGESVNYWTDNKLFIFDDTLLHQSINQSEKIRYCLFVDMLRPSVAPALMRPFVKLVHFIFKSANFVFYDKWKIIR